MLRPVAPRRQNINGNRIIKREVPRSINASPVFSRWDILLADSATESTQAWPFSTNQRMRNLQNVQIIYGTKHNHRFLEKCEWSIPRRKATTAAFRDLRGWPCQALVFGQPLVHACSLTIFRLCVSLTHEGIRELEKIMLLTYAIPKSFRWWHNTTSHTLLTQII